MYTYNKLYFQYKKLYPRYLRKLIFILNSVHGKDFNQNYWESIIGIYLRRFLLIYLFFKNNPKNRILFEKLDIKKVNFHKSYREFSNLIDFSSSRKIKFFKIPTKQIFKRYEFNNLGFIARIMNFPKILIPNILIKLNITKIFFSESYFRKNLKRYFCFKSSFSFFPFPKLELENFKIIKKEIFINRLSILNEQRSKIGNDDLLKNIIFLMPINYIENYKVIFREIEKVNLSEGIYTDGTYVSFDFIKFFIAKLKINKKKVLIGQHSLRNGLEDYDIFFDYSKSICNHFLTWGWKDKNRFIKNFSSLRIFSSIKKYNEIKKISNENLEICFILCGFSEIGESFYENFIENKKAELARIDLIKKICNFKEIKISLKPRTGSFYINGKKKFYKKFKILKYKSRMYDIFGKFDILIFERLSLGIVESIYMNQPVIFFYPKKLYRMKNSNYNDLIKKLKKAKIFFDDFKKLKKIIDSQNNINKWWLNKNNVKCREKILREYAKSFEYKDLKKLHKFYKNN